MMMRYVKYCAFALWACFGASAFVGVLTVDRSAWALARVQASVGDLYGAQSIRLELTRTGSESTDDALKSNLHASSS